MRSVILVSVAVVIAIACSGSPTSQTTYGSNGPPPHLAVGSIELRPNQASLLVSNTTRFVAIAKDASGNQLTGRTVQWSSSDSTVASVSDSGVVRALHAGRTGVIATSEGVSAAAAISVSDPPPPPVASVSVSLASPSLSAGQGTQASVVEKDASGNALTGRTVTFASSNTAVATVSSAGYVTAVAGGNAVITATSEGISGSAGVSVTALPAPVASVTVILNSSSVTVGQSTEAVVTLKDASGNILTGRSIAFASSNTGVATVSSSGSVTTVAAGTSVITATAEGVNGSATLTVTVPSSAPVASVTLTLNSGSLTVGQGTQAATTLRDASGNTLTGRTVTFASSNTAIATVSSTGYVTAVAAGNAVISATSEGVSGSATLTVTAPAAAPVSSVTVTLNSSTITTGQSTQAVVTLKDANGNTLSGRAITFASSNTGVATVTSTGSVAAVAVGTAMVTATSEGVSGSATLTVSLAPVALVSVTLNSSSLTAGQSTQAVVTLKDANGNTLTGRTVTFASSNATVATVSSTGLVTTLSLGTAQISATSEGQTGSATLNVQPTGGAVEPVYDPATNKLIVTDNFDSYASINSSAPTFTSRYPLYRTLDLNNATIPIDQVVSLIPGRTGSGQAIRIKYGNPTPGSGPFTTGVSDCIIGTEGHLGSVGAWNGTLPEKAGPYTHFLLTMWIRFSAGADPSAYDDSGVKGIMLEYATQRYEHPPHKLAGYHGERWPETRWDVGIEPSNSVTGLNQWRTPSGEPPKFSLYTDGNWHRLTYELYIGGATATLRDPSGHVGERWWIDGVLIFDNVDNVGNPANWGGNYSWNQAITHWMVFGNYVNQTVAYNSPAFTVDFDDWIAWTN